jgi:hypothetical protein
MRLLTTRAVWITRHHWQPVHGSQPAISLSKSLSALFSRPDATHAESF